jgi:enoyl-CoA hydratase
VKTARGARNLARAAYAAIDALRSVGVPLVAAVHGDAYGGGCELAAACDYRVAERHVRFHWVQARFAVTTGFGGASHLLDLVPRGVATRWLLTAEPVDCAEAHAAGFVDAVTDAGESVSEALALVDAVAVQPRMAVRRMLSLLRESGRLGPKQARTLELDQFGKSWATHDHQEAVARFLHRPR